jgi:penicillin-binding protein 2
MSWLRKDRKGIANFAMRGVKREEEQRRSVFTRRALLLGGGQFALFGFLGYRLHLLQVEQGERYATLAEENRLSARLLSPPRGRVLDRNGHVVAANRLNWRALLVAEQTSDVAATLETFHRIVPLADADRLRMWWAMSRLRPSATWTATRCSSCPASGSAGPGSSAITTR